ncbi:patatin-like phospholipase family protein [Filimonas effusa]|uniref:Patatin n=1 Tax=Filimonas effusa TaxID=2508721 RepID=A0A4V1M9D6_9BACT|nr:patatin-like phospholipase family protein [Filimonas effusa]RXK80732.1 Patatin [Filimonas effusa]
MNANIAKEPIFRPFVLSGGGARGYAHLGVLKAFEECRIFPEVISATSSGSIVAVFICDGYTPDEVLELVRHTRIGVSMQWKNMSSGFLSLKTVEMAMKQHLRHTTFEELKIPLHVTATNFITGQQTIFNKGPLIPAILAASSIPLLFQAVEIDGIPYVDGGLSGNLPATPLVPAYENIIGVHVNPLKPYKPDNSLRANIERTLLMAIREQISFTRQLCSRFIEPEDLSQYGIFDFKHFEAIYQIGLDYTRKLLREHPEQAI